MPDTLTGGRVASDSANLNETVTQQLSALVARTAAIEQGMSVLIGEMVRLVENVAAARDWQRRDLRYAADVAAAASSAAFIQEHLPTVLALPDPATTLRYAAGLVKIPGMALEFGVATGSTLRQIVQHLPGRPVVGFDVFTGLPEDWRTGFPAGMFSQPAPLVPGAEIVEGLFADSLPGFLATHPGPVAFLHLDADLYSSTATVLRYAGPRLVPGSIVLFDEYFNYPSWQRHEHRAWQEFVAQTGIRFAYEAYAASNEQLVVRITAVPWH